MDMSQVIVPKSDQVNADSLISGPITVEIADVAISGGTEQPVSIHLVGTKLVYRPCKSMSRVLVSAYGPDARKYVGKKLTLYRDPKVKWGGMEVGGIRISHLSGIEKEMVLMLTMTKQNRAPHRVKPLVSDAPVTKPDAIKSGAESPPPPTDAMDQAEAAAQQGTHAFKVWWNSDVGKLCRDAVRGNMDALKKLASDADASKPAPDDEEMPM
ncbi:MAG: hypothetical protein PF443_00390 [Allgaiera sp.]|jgi:hypothetical protein|nr:hypothetical protein [Allgaiera sp.]